MSHHITKSLCESPEHVSQVERRARLAANRYLRVKPILDFFVATSLFVLLLPVALLAMILVSATSWGWPIYSQVRLGRHGRLFRIFKIRSMYTGCERRTGPAWSSGDDDPRITPVGRIFRATHIDELPQLVNVLLGQMSLVGPRPERPVFTAQLEKAYPTYHERHLVRPGITGLAQVQLPPDVEMEDVAPKLVCDLYYVQTVSAWLDVRLALCTALGACRVPFKRAGKLLRIPALAKIDCVCTEPKVAWAGEAGVSAPQLSHTYAAGREHDERGERRMPSEQPIRVGGVQVQTI